MAAARDRPDLLAESGSFVRVLEDGQVLRAAGDVPDEASRHRSGPGFATVDAGGGQWRTLDGRAAVAARLFGQRRSGDPVRRRCRAARGPHRLDAARAWR